METLVQGTNDSSIISKDSMVRIGYFQDDYIKYFIRKPTRRTPLINIGYYVRSVIIHSYLKFYLDSVSSQIQVLSLGAGFDTTFFRLASKYDLVYFEVDLPDVVKNKITCLKSNEALNSLIHNPQDICYPLGLKSDSYVIISQDLSDISELEIHLLNLGLDFSKPTIIFSECAITYMEESRSTNLIRWTNKMFPQGVFLNYEQINPTDGFGLVMKKHFVKVQSPLKSVEFYKTTKDQQERFISCGWQNCKSISAMDLFNLLIPVKEQEKLFKMEPFDEWEEWHLKCCHYSLTVAHNGNNKFPDINYPLSCSDDKIHGPIVDWEICKDIIINRFAHCTLMFDKLFLIIGGFGSLNSRHGRTKIMLLINCATNVTQEISLQSSFLALDALYSTCTKISEEEFVIYGGRTSPLRPVNASPHYVLFSSQNDEIIMKTNEILINGIKPRPRWRHIAICLNRVIILFGGRTNDLQILGDVWLLRLENGNRTGCWEDLTLSSKVIPSPRFSHAATDRNDTVFLSGGMSADYKPLEDFWTLKLKMFDGGYQTKWEKLEIIGLKSRYNHTSHISGSFVVLIGGVNTSLNQPSITVVNLDLLSATDYILSDNELGNPIMLHNHTSIFRESESIIYIVGGGGNCFSFGTSFNSNIIKIPIKQF